MLPFTSLLVRPYTGACRANIHFYFGREWQLVGFRPILQAEETGKEAVLEGREIDASDVYQGNIEFWGKAWGMVKVPYTQLPSLSYIPRIPETLNAYKVKRVLDLGCGSGWLSVYLARQSFEVVGIDVSAQAIALAETWALQEELKIAFSVGDIANMPFAEKSFDAVVANSIFEHFPLDTAHELTAKVHNILTDEGVFIGCFDEVGGGPGQYFSLEDGTHVYTDKARKGMLLRRYSNPELQDLFSQFATMTSCPVDAGSTFVVAAKKILS